MNARFRTTGALAALALTTTLGLSACGGSDSSAAAGSGTTADAGADTFGAGCADVPADGAGSFNGMATAPVASAASANPDLKTLVTAVTKAGLVDTLNNAKGITVFAPDNDAFAKIPAKDLKSVLADKATLTKILTHHVIAGQLSPDQLAGTHKTLAGDTVKVTGSGESFQVGATEKASVVCGNVPTANATVYIIDSVLMPS
ncbi:MAG: fasciclin domain-containing protein [Nocardioides sp.]